MTRPRLPTIAALLVASSLAATASEADAQNLRRFCDAGNSCFVCTRGQPICEIAYALSRATTPPSMDALLPAQGAPLPPELVPPGRVATPPSKNAMPVPMHSPLTRDAERENVIRQGDFCRRYPDDKVCHPLSPAPPPDSR